MNKFLQKLAKILLGLSMAAGVGVAIGAGKAGARQLDAAAGDKVSFVYTTSSSKKLSTTYGANTLADDSISGLSISCTTAKTSGSGVIQNTYNTTYGGQQMTTNANRNTTVTFTFGDPWSGTHATYKDYTQINSVTFTAVAGSSTSYNVTCTIDGVAATGDNSGFSATKTTTTFTPASGHNKGIIVITVAYSSGSKGWYFDNLGINAEVPADSTKTLSSIALSGTYPTTFSQGDTFSHSGMVVTATYDDSTTADVSSSATWSSPDMSTTGSKTITVSYTEDGITKTATYSITVSAPISVTGVTLNKDSSSIEIGNTDTLTATVAPSDASNKSVTWSTSDSSIATVANGVVTAVAVGSATITVTTVDGSYTASCSVTVTRPSYTNTTGYSEDKVYAIYDGSAYLRGEDASKQPERVDAISSATVFTITLVGNNTFTFVSDSKYLYATNTNNGVRYGSTSDSWLLTAVSGGFTFKDTTNNRYLSSTPNNTGTWSNGDWRCYTSTGTGTTTLTLVEVTTTATINGDDEVIMGSSWSPTSVTEDVGGATVTGVTFAFAASDGATLTSQDTSTGAFTSSTTGTVTVSGTKSGYTITSKVVTVVSNSPYIILTLNSASSAYTGQTVSISASYGNGVTGLTWTVQSGTVSDASSSNSGYSAKIAGSTGTLTIRATDTGSNLFEEVSVDVTKTAFATSPSNASVQEGKTTTLSAVLNSGGNINWSSGDNTIATIGQSTGVVTGVAEGSVTITAQSADDTSVTATCTITVTEAPGEIVITSAEIASFASSYAERDWTYGSGTAAISGKIKAYKNGDNIQMNQNNACYFYNIDAVPGYITGITLTKVSGTTDMTAWVGDEMLSSDPASGGTTNTTYTWTFDPADHHSYFRVATSGSTGARVFSALTITYQKVALVDPTSITITDKTAISMDTYGYGKRNLTAVVGPVNANDKTVTWGTSDSSVVTIENGVLTPVGVGDAIVYATAVGYVSDQATPALKDSVSVHVTQALYKKATFTPTSLTTATQGDDYLAAGSVSLTNTSAGTWSSEKSAIQLSQGKDATFTISGYAGMMIEGIDMVVSSNGNAGTGSLNVTAGSTTVLSIATASFDDSSWNGAYDANPVQLYRDITDYVVDDSETIVFTFAATINSLYIHSVSFRYIDYSLQKWCIDFLADVTCDGSSAITDDSKWDDLGIEFLDLDEDLQAIAAGATANKDSDDVIEQAMARYDLIIRKYGTDTSSGGHDDFIGRFGEGTINGVLNQSKYLLSNVLGKDPNTVAIIVIISMVSVTAIGGYFFLRKRKENI